MSKIVVILLNSYVVTVTANANLNMRQHLDVTKVSHKDHVTVSMLLYYLNHKLEIIMS